MGEGQPMTGRASPKRSARPVAARRYGPLREGVAAPDVVDQDVEPPLLAGYLVHQGGDLLGVAVIAAHRDAGATGRGRQLCSVHRARVHIQTDESTLQRHRGPPANVGSTAPELTPGRQPTTTCERGLGPRTRHLHTV